MARVLRATAIGVAAAFPLFAGCGSDSGGTYSGGSYRAGAAATATGASPKPMLVDVDPDKTMTAEPGQGVGVFTEYVTGGHWHVWWTCDTSRTNATCSFAVSVSVASGAIANVVGESLQPSDQLVQTSASQIDVTTQTSTASEGVRFDGPPGAIVTLDAKLNGAEDGNLLFFVQKNLVNGSYKGTLTDPLMFEPAAP
jgi:hypothetical protein